MTPEKSPKVANATQFKAARRPHNASAAVDRSLKDLVSRIANEPRNVMINGETRTISRGERVLRLTVARAVDGKVREIDAIMKLMIENPDLAASVRTTIIYFVNGNLADV